jgi:hypothetical protein
MDTGTAVLALLRGAHLAALLSLFGTLMFTVVAAPPALRARETAEPTRTMLIRHARLGLFLALAFGIAWFAAEAYAIAIPHSPRNWLTAPPTVARDTRLGQFLAVWLRRGCSRAIAWRRPRRPGTPTRRLSGCGRAAWLPNSGRGWSTPDELIARVRLICTHPIAINPRSEHEQGGHEHHD